MKYTSYDEAKKLIAEKKADNKERELHSIQQALEYWTDGMPDEVNYSITRLTTEGSTSQPRGDFRVVLTHPDEFPVTYWVEVKHVGAGRWKEEYLEDFKIPMPVDFRSETGWGHLDLFLFVIVNGETGQARMFQLDEPWEVPLARWKSWGNYAGWDRKCFSHDLSEVPEFQIHMPQELFDRYAAQRDIRMYGGY